MAADATEVTDEAYYQRLDDLNVAAYWRMELAAQVPGAVPFVWHWKDLYPALADSVELVELQRGGAERRVITMANPARRGRPRPPALVRRLSLHHHGPGRLHGRGRREVPDAGRRPHPHAKHVLARPRQRRQRPNGLARWPG